MKMEIWPDDVSMPEMTDWLAELRDEGRAEAADDGLEGQAGTDEASPEISVLAQADTPVSSDQASDPAKASPPSQTRTSTKAGSPGRSWPPAETGLMDRPWPPAETSPAGQTWPTTDTSPTGRIRVPAEASPTGRTRSPAKPSAPVEITERAVIGDELRVPIMWCEMGSCISWHADPAALGEADIRARAIDVGWRVDALGRLACPRCQQTASGFRVSRPVVLWDRYAAITRAARMAGLRGNGAAAEHGREPRLPASHRSPVSHRAKASSPEPERRREHQAAKTATVGRHAR